MRNTKNTVVVVVGVIMVVGIVVFGVVVVGVIVVEMETGVVVTVDLVAGMVVVMDAHTGSVGWKVAGEWREGDVAVLVCSPAHPMSPCMLRGVLGCKWGSGSHLR